MLLKVGTQVSNALKITLTKFHQHLSTGSQVFEGWHKRQRRLTTRSRLCYRPHREITRCGQKWFSTGNHCSFDFLLTHIYQLLKVEIRYKETEDQNLCRSFFKKSFILDQSQICILNGLGARALQSEALLSWK